jgi:sortase A
MASGIFLMGWGTWIFLQFQIEAHRPPPARILEVTVENPIAQVPPTLRPTPAQAQPAPISQNKAEDEVKVEPSPITQASGTTPVAARALTPSPTVTITPTKTTESWPAETRFLTVTAVPPTSTPTPLPAPTEATEEALSLADNPLLVVEAETMPAVTETEPEDPAGSATFEAAPITRVVAESIDLDAEVVKIGWQQVVENGITTNVWVVADYAAGWHENSALPGQGGNIVLSGHHNIKGEVFRYIVDLEVGDVVTLYEAERSYDYVVVDKFIVKDRDESEAIRRENAKWIGPFNEERLTLVTCWPYTTNTHRAIVIGKPADTVQLPEQ